MPNDGKPYRRQVCVGLLAILRPDETNIAVEDYLLLPASVLLAERVGLPSPMPRMREFRRKTGIPEKSAGVLRPPLCTTGSADLAGNLDCWLQPWPKLVLYKSVP